MAKKICSICGEKAGLLGFDIAQDQRICGNCFAAANPYMKKMGQTDPSVWTMEEVKTAMQQEGGAQGDAQGNLGDLLIVSTEFITGQNFQTISFVSGSRFVFTGVIAESDINRAISEMRRSALNLGADAIIGFRYAPSNNHAYVWGTAVKYI